MSGSVDQVQDVVLAIKMEVHLYGVALDSDPSLTLQIHVVKHLCLQVLGGYSIGIFKQTVGKSALAVVNMGYDTKIADILHNWLQI